MTVTNNIELMFSKLVNDPKDLMKVMKESGDFLSGSRAANFFVDGICKVDSDWDFYCRCSDADKISQECLLYKYFKNIGCVWNDVERTYNDQVINVFKGTLNGKTVQLIGHYLEDPIDGVLGYNSTATQSIITHDSALCMYYDLLESKRAIEWTTKLSLHDIGMKYDGDGSTYKKANIHLQKYTERGVKYIPYKEYGAIVGFNVKEPRLRKAGDKSTKFLHDNDNNSLQNITWLECAEGCVLLQV